MYRNYLKSTFVIFVIMLLLMSGGMGWAQGQLKRADVDESGVVEYGDLFLIQQYWHQSIQDVTDLQETVFSEFYQLPSYEVVASVTPYTLPVSKESISNWGGVQALYDLSALQDLILQNGFAVVASVTGESMIKPYEELWSFQLPAFVTTDSLLHLYHVQFDKTLKDIEEREFSPTLQTLTQALLQDAQSQVGLYEGRMAEAVALNVNFFSVALRLLDPAAEIPQSATQAVEDELALIDAHSGFASSPLFVYDEDYSQYVPRGHYTDSETLERYFRAMMWYGRIGFLLKNSEMLPAPNAEIQTLSASLIAESLQRVGVEDQSAWNLWNRIYSVTSFYVGVADDLTPADYLDGIESVGVSSSNMALLAEEDTYQALRAYLGNLRNPEIYGGTGNCVLLPPFDPSQIDECLEKSKGMRLMGQRFIPDSYMFQNLVSADYIGQGNPFTLVVSGAGRLMRGFPRGLDVMDILGSDRAYQILLEEGDTEYLQYPEQRRELISEFSQVTEDEWNQNLYWGWLYCLKSLLGGYGSGYPSFMQTRAWNDKNLNTALASWSELRHDTILYAKQSYTPVETGIPPLIRGYVEPVPEFYARLLALLQMTRTGLDDLQVLDDAARIRLERFEDIVENLFTIAVKELNNEPLSNDEYYYIQGIGTVLKDTLQEVEEDAASTVLIADVHTDANTSMVLEEGTGYVDMVAVVIPQPDGSLQIAMGPVFSYYEFKYPMANRLTDEAWQILLTTQAPQRPSWVESFLR